MINKVRILGLLWALGACGHVTKRWDDSLQGADTNHWNPPKRRPYPSRPPPPITPTLLSPRLQPPQRTADATLLTLPRSQIAAGMSKSDVISTWGRPARRDIAGRKRYQNERWVYPRGEGIKLIYFEGGVVQGWEVLE